MTTKILNGQKSSSCLVPSKESAIKSKQLLTGAQLIDKYNETENALKDIRGIRSFIVEESKLKKSLI